MLTRADHGVTLEKAAEPCPARHGVDTGSIVIASVVQQMFINSTDQQTAVYSSINWLNCYKYL